MMLRRAGPADAAAIRHLARAVYAKWIPAIGREPWPMSADYDKAVRNHWIDLAEDEQGLLAMVEMIPHAAYLLVENIAVRADAQGRGIAAILLAHAETAAQQNNLREVRLYTNAAFRSNVDYYPRRGYHETARTPLPDGGTTVHFAKRIV